jgi:hypothetical protein
LLDAGGHLTQLLLDVSRCRECAKAYPGREDQPINALVRPLPLERLRTQDSIEKYFIRVRRDHGLLRNLFDSKLSYEEMLLSLHGARFSLGLLPWLDRCMMYRKSRKTDLMVIGIDYKNLPVFFKSRRDHSFPLDSYLKRSNIWGPTWRRFWQNLLRSPYDDDSANDFITAHGFYVTNSILCFGGSDDAGRHSWEYIECCRPHIEEQIRIVQPRHVASFGNLGCRNVASILQGYNPACDVLRLIGNSLQPLKTYQELTSTGRRQLSDLKFENRPIAFFPLYQPARAHVWQGAGEYEELRQALGLSDVS